MTTDIKVGDFITASYKYTAVCGMVVEVKKTIVVINKYKQRYNEFTPTDTLLNITKSRVYRIGFSNNAIIKTNGQ